MKRLTVVRHAHAGYQDGTSTDFDRPLSRRGAREAIETGMRLAALELRPDVILTSPAQRAADTAVLLARELGYGEHLVRRHSRLYLAPAMVVGAVIATVEPGAVHVLVVGHNPGLSDFVRCIGPREGSGRRPGFELATAAFWTCLLDLDAWELDVETSAQEIVHEAPQHRPDA